MSKRSWLFLLVAFIFFYIINRLMPLAFGDDYLYAFIWQGKPMYIPLTEDAVKISSLHELISSQVAFYFTWSGRVINNTLSQLFVWAGKDVFNFFNAFASVLLVLEVYWCANKGRITLGISFDDICWLLFLFWAFTPSLPAVAFWLVGACHYLWPAVFLTGFIIPFIHKYYFFEAEPPDNTWFKIVMFFFGIIAGCTNENSVCWVILLLLFFVLKSRKMQGLESWMYVGLIGLSLGYAILIFSPGNFARLVATHRIDWLNLTKLTENLHVLAVTFLIQFFLWYFCLRSMYQTYSALNQCTEKEKEKIKKELNLIKVLCFTSISMSAIMLLSPEFHLRSAFPGTVHLMIVVGIVLRVQKEYDIILLHRNVKSFLTCIAVIYFMVTAGFTLQHLYAHYIYHEKLLTYITAFESNGNKTQIVLNVEPFPVPAIAKDFLSGFHTFSTDVSQDVNCWTNVAFARYYGIKGIRVIDSLKEKNPTLDREME